MKLHLCDRGSFPNPSIPIPLGECFVCVSTSLTELTIWHISFSQKWKFFIVFIPERSKFAEREHKEQEQFN